MKPLLALSLFTLLAGCAGSFVPPGTGGKTVDYVEEKDNHLGWAGIYIDESRTDVEKMLGAPLVRHPHAPPYCGGWWTAAPVQGRDVGLGFDSEAADAKVDNITVYLPESEYGIGMTAMAGALLQRFQDLKTILTGADGVTVEQHDGSTVLIRNRKDHYINLSSVSCL